MRGTSSIVLAQLWSQSQPSQQRLEVSNPIISYEIVHARSHFTLVYCVAVVVLFLHGKYVSNLNCRQSNCSAGTTNQGRKNWQQHSLPTRGTEELFPSKLSMCSIAHPVTQQRHNTAQHCPTTHYVAKRRFFPDWMWSGVSKLVVHGFPCSVPFQIDLGLMNFLPL